ncbi:hypothetical protein CSAL01_12873 [Colletotrichum salicis]|uniref:Uncharacterized protein n=1 Tax=Colletotrichum salicis TaxID=1209931 RepID=A0A135S1J9_9PEZI|nr:hypothetical protein CSAL01_12873 [Colletotrichum salicis]
MAGRPDFANVNTNDTDGMMLTSCTVVHVKTAKVKVRVIFRVGNTGKALTSMDVQTIFLSVKTPNPQSSRQSSTINSCDPRREPEGDPSNHSNGALCGSAQGHVKGGKVRGSRVQVDRRRRRRRRRRSAACLNASRLVVRAAMGPMKG